MVVFLICYLEFHICNLGGRGNTLPYDTFLRLLFVQEILLYIIVEMNNSRELNIFN